MQTFFHPALCVCILSRLLTTAHAAEIRVQPAGPPGAPVVAEALEKATAGDALILAPGVYHERITIGKTVTLHAEDGVVMDGSQSFAAEWKAAGEELPGVFVQPLKYRPAGVLLAGNFIAGLDFDRAQKEGVWHWKTLLKKGPPRSGFDEIKALYVYHPKEKQIYLRLPEGADPNDQTLAYVKDDEPLILISNARDVVLKNLTLRHGATAVRLEKAQHCRIEKCHIATFEKNGILLTDETANCTVEDCTITRGALEEWTPRLENNKANYEIWLIHKEVGYYDRIGINLFRTGRGNRILNNRIEKVFDGICLGDYSCETLAKPLRDPDHGRETEIAGNVIENTRDSGIELGVGCMDVHVHHNILRRTHGGFRFKTPRIGPVFIHHNQLIDGAPFNFWFSIDSSPATGYIYHNTIVNGSAAFASLIHKPTQNAAAPNWHFYNNLVLTKDGFFRNRKNNVPVDFHAGYNLSTGEGRPWPDEPDRDPGSRYGLKMDLKEPTQDIPVEEAVDAGRDLSTLLDGKPLPGAEAASVKGKAPDVGAMEWR